MFPHTTTSSSSLQGSSVIPPVVTSPTQTPEYGDPSGDIAGGDSSGAPVAAGQAKPPALDEGKTQKERPGPY
eukprot:9255278-Karenia_brevis.AAC.1